MVVWLVEVVAGRLVEVVGSPVEVVAGDLVGKLVEVAGSPVEVLVLVPGELPVASMVKLKTPLMSILYTCTKPTYY